LWAGRFVLAGGLKRPRLAGRVEGTLRRYTRVCRTRDGWVGFDGWEVEGSNWRSARHVEPRRIRPRISTVIPHVTTSRMVLCLIQLVVWSRILTEAAVMMKAIGLANRTADTPWGENRHQQIVADRHSQ